LEGEDDPNNHPGQFLISATGNLTLQHAMMPGGFSAGADKPIIKLGNAIRVFTDSAATNGRVALGDVGILGDGSSAQLAGHTVTLVGDVSLSHTITINNDPLNWDEDESNLGPNDERAIKVTKGDVDIQDGGLILQSPNNTRYLVNVENSGSLVITQWDPT